MGDPITKMLKKMMADISEIKTDVKGNNNKTDDLTSKVENLETKQKEAEEHNTNALKETKDDLANVEKSVTSKLMKEIEPSLGVMKNEIQDNVNSNMRRLIQEEMALQKIAEVKEKKDESKKNEETDNSNESESDAPEENRGEP